MGQRCDNPFCKFPGVHSHKVIETHLWECVECGWSGINEEALMAHMRVYEHGGLSSSA